MQGATPTLPTEGACAMNPTSPLPSTWPTDAPFFWFDDSASRATKFCQALSDHGFILGADTNSGGPGAHCYSFPPTVGSNLLDNNVALYNHSISLQVAWDADACPPGQQVFNFSDAIAFAECTNQLWEHDTKSCKMFPPHRL